jgi:AraC family transcriptional regulator
MRVYREQMLAMLLQLCCIEIGWRRSELTRFDYDAGEIMLPRRHVETWARTDSLQYLSVGISDAALRAACNGIASQVELRNAPKLEDARVGALVAAVNAERIAGFPSGTLFLDSVEQALAAVPVDRYAVRRPSLRRYRGGLSPALLRRVKELVQAKIENELTLHEMAQCVGLSTAHFSDMFRKSTGESPLQFVLRERVERAKEMLRADKTRVLDVAVACGFKNAAAFCASVPPDLRSQPYGVSIRRFGIRASARPVP